MSPAARTSRTLPDLLRPGLEVVFVGINPSIYSVEQGHYFARASNRFWPCLSLSVLSARARAALGVERLVPQHDRLLPVFGIGFTDVVKRATAKASELTDAELKAGAQDLQKRLARHRPLVACFHGVTGYRHVHQGLTGDGSPVVLGLQAARIGPTALFVVPNPSGANAHFTRQDQTRWYDELAAYLQTLPR